MNVRMKNRKHHFLRWGPLARGLPKNAVWGFVDIALFEACLNMLTGIHKLWNLAILNWKTLSNYLRTWKTWKWWNISTRWFKMLYLWFKTLYLSLKTLYLSMSPIKVFMATVENIAKGTTDPRVEFILPKLYRKFKHKSWSKFIFRILTQHQLEISTKHQHLH